MPAPNKQFATSGGATRPSDNAEQHLLALVRAFAIPPPDAKPRHVARKLWRIVQADNEVNKGNYVQFRLRIFEML